AGTGAGKRRSGREPTEPGYRPFVKEALPATPPAWLLCAFPALPEMALSGFCRQAETDGNVWRGLVGRSGLRFAKTRTTLAGAGEDFGGGVAGVAQGGDGLRGVAFGEPAAVGV